MFKALLRTDREVSALVLRIFVAVVFFPHGAQKVLGWFGGHGLEAAMTAFTVKMHIPFVFAVLAVAAEFLGPIGLFFGFLTRVAAFGIAFEMLVAILMVHLRFGFFMNWFGQKTGEGFEYHVLLIGACGGLWSVDRAITKEKA